MTLKYVDPWAARSPSEDQIKSLQQPATSKNQNSGFFGDFVDAVQQGAYQSAAGDAEAVGQISDSDTFKSIGKALSKGANSQTDTMTRDAKQALSQHIFKDDPDSFTGVAFDDGATNWRTWALQFGVLGGQVAGTVATGFGAGTVVKLGAKQVIKSVAKEAITKEAQQLVAKNAVKEAIRNGALDDVRAALIAAPDKAAINSVLNTATSRLGGIATTAVAGSMAAGMRAQQARDEYLGLDADTLNQNPEFQKAYWEIADNPENQGLDTATIHNAAKEMLAEKAATTAFFDKKALLSDLASGAYVPGAGGVIGRGAATASKMGRFGIGLAKEGAPEAWQGGETQRAVNEAIKEWGDESRDPMADVVRTRYEEGLLGGIFGGGAKVFEGQHQAPTKPIVTVENSPSTGNSTLDSALAQSNADEQSRYDTLTGHVDELSKPAYMRNGDISPELENAIAQFRLDAMQQQQAQQRKDGIMQPFDNPVAGNPDEPAFLRSRNFNPTGRDLTGNEDVNPESPVQQALARSAGQDRSLESQLADTMANGDQGKTPQEDFVTGEWLRWDQRQPMSEPNRIESGVTMPGESREILPESRGLGYNNQINMGGQPGNGINDNYVPPVTANRVTADQSLDVESTRDPRSPVAKSIAQAGTESDSIFGQLKSLRVTRRGKPFGSVKEAQLASRKTETPIELPTGGFGVVDKAELEKVQASQAPTATVMNVGTKSDNVIDQASLNERGDNRESPWLFADGKVVSSNGDHISLSDEYGYSGYRDMSKGTGAIRSTFYKPHNATDEQTPFVSLQLFDDQKLTPEQFKSVESFVKANDAKITLGVDRSGNNTDNVEKNEVSLDELKGKYTADQAAGTPSPETVTAPVVAMDSQPTPASNAEQISESDLKDLDLLKEHAGKWKYRYAVGANWQTANSKESAIERAQEAHQKAIANGDPLPTKDERYATSETEQTTQMEQRYGKMSIPELEKEHARLGGVVSDLQQTGKNEFNGNGGRRTSAATANEGARDAGLEKMRLESYIQTRKEREPVTGNNENAIDNAPEPATNKSEKTIQDHFNDLNKFHRGDLSFDEFKQASSDFLDNEEAVKAKLSSLTKPEILKRMGAMFNYNHKGDKKDVIVDAAYQSLAGQLRFAAHGDKDVITETVSFEEIQGKRARKTTASKAREEIAALTSDKYGIYQEKAKAATKKAEERFQKVKQQISDPKTLDDFETFLNYRSIDKLTPEQKARYEDLKAERNLDKRDQAAAAAKETKVVPTATGDIVKTKHTKEGHDLFVVKLADRVDRDAYTTINAKAKELGGYYSKFRGNGAVPGFQFRTEEQAKEFQQWLSNAGNQTTSVEDVKATTDITAEPEVTSDESSKKKQADKLRDRAASVREKAQAELNADRKSNTVKRAREAAYAVARAEADLRFANILDAIANGIEAGEIKYLRNMTAGTQLETLDTVLRRIVRSNKMSQAIRDDLIQKGYLRKGDDAELSWTDSAPIEVITQYAEMPGMDYWANILRDTAKNMQTTTGFKQAGVKIMNQVLMAINAENRMVTISDPDLIDKLKQFSKQHEVRDYLKDTMADYDRLVRMGITSPIELRAALRELHKVKQSLKGTRPKRDPVKQKEDALKMRLLNNRNAFVDFFPTPEDHANDVIARAGIEPGMRVLEPSAGHGALAVAARDAGATVDAVELSGELRDILTEKGFNLVGSDFMATEPAGEYDAVVMNPPFSNDMDIDHVKHAYAHLKPGGRLVAIVSSMAGERSNNKNKQFKEWLDSLGATEEMMPEGSFKNSMNPTSVRTKIIELQKPADSENVKPQPMGSRVTIHTPKGKPVEVQYQLVSAADLVASNEFDGRVNKAYPQELQPRDRTKASYQQQVKQIASNPEGSRLAGSPESDRGAPIVRDLVVESGNGRTIGIKQAYKQGTATEYRDYLIKHADEFGFTADDVNLIDDPVLIRQRVSDLSPEERLDFVVDSNTDAKMANSATEDAKADARYLDNGLMDLLNIPEGGDLLAASNERFLSSFATKLGVNSLNIYKDSAGRWNEAFRKRVSNAIFAYGYDNDTLLKAATGDTSEAGKNLTNALMNNAAKVAELRSMVPESAKSFVNYLAEGIDVMTSAKRNGQSIQEVVNQGDMLSGGVSHYGGAMAEMLADASRSGKRLTEILNQITGMLNESAKAADQIDLLTGEPTQQVTAEEAINAAEKDFNERKDQEQRVRPGQDLFGANPTRIGDNNGSGASVSRPVSESETESTGENNGLTLADIRIPTIDKTMNDEYNRVAHVWGKTDFNESLKSTAQNLIDSLSDPKKHLLDTKEQRDYAASAINTYLSNEAKQIRADIASAQSNPSWIVTGRSNRDMKKYNAAIDKEAAKLSAHVKSQQEDWAHIRSKLDQMKPQEVKTKELFTFVSAKLGTAISSIAEYMRDGRSALEKDTRKWASPDAGKFITQLIAIDREATLSALAKVDDSLQDVGGLVKVLGARSAAGKLASGLLGAEVEKAQFSKQPLNEAEKSGQGMKPGEARLAANEWLRQFKTDVQVKVAKDQAEFEQLLAEQGQGDTLAEGEQANAAYIAGSKTLLLNASAIQNPGRLRQIMRHEILGHHGLEYVIGKGAVNDILQILKNGYNTSKAIRDAVDTVAANYAGADSDTKIKEAFAHYAENRPVDQGALGRLWDRVVSAVKSALVKAGFIRANEAEQQLDSLLKTIAEHMRQGRTNNDPNGGPGNKTYFSKNKNGDTSAYGQAESLLKESGSSLVNWLKQQRGRGLGTLTDLQIDQIYRDITGGAINRYQKLRTKMESDRNDILLEAETKYEPMWEALPEKAKAALSQLMHDATMSRLHPDKSLEENSLYQEVKAKLAKARTEKTKAEYQAELDIIRDNYRSLSERYRLADKQSKALYATMRDLYAKQWATLRDAISQRIEDQLGEGGKALASEMRLKMEQALKHGPYFPLARFGKYVIRGKKGDQYFREHFEKRKDAEAALKQYRSEGFRATLSVKEEGSGDQANAHALGMEIMEALDKAQKDGTEPADLKDAVWQAMLEMLPDASFAKHAIHRKRVKGASRDGHRAYLQSVYHYAHHVSKIRYGHKMKAELDAMKDQVKLAERGEESSIKPDDIEVAQQVLNEMNKRHELNMNPKGSSLAGMAGNIGFLFYLGASPASAVINLTQNVMVMLPQLAGKYGLMKASKFMMKAMSDYIRHGVFKSGTKEAWVSLTRATKGVSADEKEMLNTLYRAGVLDLTQAHSIAARADTDQQDIKQSAAWARTGMRWAGSLFHNAEVLNREVAALTAYRLLKEQNPSISMESAADQVTEMVYDGHGNYAASNRPRYMRGDVMKVLTQFKIYSQMMTYTLARNAILAAKGDKAALKTLGAMFGTTWLMSGAMGLPTPVSLLLYGIAAAFDDDDDRSAEASFRLGLTEALGPELGELIAKGPMDDLTGLNISGRTGLGDLWWRSPKEGTEGDDLTFHYMQQVAGPVLGIGVSGVRGLREFANGDIQRGIEAVSPKAIKDLAKAYRQATEGEQTRNGDSVIDDVGAWNVAMQAMGFSSAQMGKVYSAREYIKGKEKVITEQRSNLLADYFDAMQSGDRDEMMDVMTRIKAFNKSHKEEAITGKSMKLSIKSRKRSMERTQAGVYLNKNREYLRSEGKFLEQ